MRFNRRQQRVKKRTFIALGVCVLILVVIGVVQLMKSPSLQNISIGKKADDKPLNILLLGVGGGTHEGPDLTDTIIFTQLDPKKQRITLASIPRDLWVPDLDAKINAIYVTGEEKKKGGGLMLAKATVQKIVDQPIDYVVRIDFAGFTKGVDMMGGLDIDVERTFDDFAYPVTGKEIDPCGNDEIKIASLSAEIASGSATESDAFPCRYEHLHFDKGQREMDGETALKYVRSRHALGPEGSDFARSKRQEKVISAFKQELFSAGTLLNPAKVIGLLNVLSDSIKTDIPATEYTRLIGFLQEMKGAKTTSAIIDTGDSSEERLGLLKDPLTRTPYGGAWVVVPRQGADDYTEIQAYIACVLAGKTCLVDEEGIVTPTPEPTETTTSN